MIVVYASYIVCKGVRVLQVAWGERMLWISSRLPGLDRGWVIYTLQQFGSSRVSKAEPSWKLGFDIVAANVSAYGKDMAVQCASVLVPWIRAWIDVFLRVSTNFIPCYENALNSSKTYACSKSKAEQILLCLEQQNFSFSKVVQLQGK